MEKAIIMRASRIIMGLVLGVCLVATDTNLVFGQQKDLQKWQVVGRTNVLDMERKKLFTYLIKDDIRAGCTKERLAEKIVSY